MSAPHAPPHAPGLAGALLLVQQPIAIGSQNALEPAGPNAERIDALWTFMLWTSTVLTLLTFALFAWALFRRRDPAQKAEADRQADPRGEALNDESGGRGREEVGRPRSERLGVRFMVGAGVVVPAIVLGVTLVLTMRTLDAVALPSRAVGSFDAMPAPGTIAVEVTGRQYWWEVTYLDSIPQRRFETANELRIPVGVPVVVRLRSGDVIHSFWVPGLHGKMDLIPGRVNALRLEASRPGVYRGQCAEYCGVQHAKMAFTVVALEREEYERWVEGQRRPARPPADSARRADEATFLASGCALCHQVRGTPAGGELGPDLTHLASRLTLAAGTLPNTPGHLFGWVANPQAIKRGNHMPAVPMSSEELHAIVRYLGTLE